MQVLAQVCQVRKRLPSLNYPFTLQLSHQQAFIVPGHGQLAAIRPNDAALPDST